MLTKVCRDQSSDTYYSWHHPSFTIYHLGRKNIVEVTKRSTLTKTGTINFPVSASNRLHSWTEYHTRYIAELIEKIGRDECRAFCTIHSDFPSYANDPCTLNSRRFARKLSFGIMGTHSTGASGRGFMDRFFIIFILSIVP